MVLSLTCSSFSKGMVKMIKMLFCSAKALPTYNFSFSAWPLISTADEVQVCLTEHTTLSHRNNIYKL